MHFPVLGKWKETHCLWRKTSFKAIFCCWKTPISNEYQPFFHLLTALLKRKIAGYSGTNNPICWLENNGKTLDYLVGKCQKIQNLFSEPVNAICFAMKHTHTQNNEIDKYLKIYVEITVLYTTEMPKFIIIIHGKRVRCKIIPNSWKEERLFKFQLEMICK